MVHGFARDAVSPTSARSRERRPAQLEPGDWLWGLAGTGRDREEAVAALHALLLRAARFERARRGQGRMGDVDGLANQAVDDALMAVLRKLPTYRGDSCLTTWACKFALLETAVQVRRRSWQGREVPLVADGWAPPDSRPPARCGRVHSGRRQRSCPDRPRRLCGWRRHRRSDQAGRPRLPAGRRGRRADRGGSHRNRPRTTRCCAASS